MLLNNDFLLLLLSLDVLCFLLPLKEEAALIAFSLTREEADKPFTKGMATLFFFFLLFFFLLTLVFGRFVNDDDDEDGDGLTMDDGLFGFVIFSFL
jgi:hypothetical protein